MFQDNIIFQLISIVCLIIAVVILIATFIKASGFDEDFDNEDAMLARGVLLILIAALMRGAF